MVFYNKKCNSRVIIPFQAIPGFIEYRNVKNIIFLCLLVPSIAHQIKIQA